MTYSPAAIAAYFDALGTREWERFDGTLGDRVSLAMHTALLERYVRPGHRILDVGAGPGRFTELLHRLGARVAVADLSGRQLELNRAALRDMPRAAIRTIVATGDLTAETDPTSRHYCHMYRAAELRAFLEKPGLTVEQISASSALATGVETEFITAPEQWEAWLEYEAVA